MFLKEIRTKRNLTQQEVADAIGCSSVVYNRYEKGTRQPSVEVLIRLAELFDVTVDYLLGRQTVEDSTLSKFEIELVTAAREADNRAREDAIAVLRLHRIKANKE